MLCPLKIDLRRMRNPIQGPHEGSTIEGNKHMRTWALNQRPTWGLALFIATSWLQSPYLQRGSVTDTQFNVLVRELHDGIQETYNRGIDAFLYGRLSLFISILRHSEKKIYVYIYIHISIYIYIKCSTFCSQETSVVIINFLCD